MGGSQAAEGRLTVKTSKISVRVFRRGEHGQWFRVATAHYPTMPAALERAHTIADGYAKDLAHARVDIVVGDTVKGRLYTENGDIRIPEFLDAPNEALS